MISTIETKIPFCGFYCSIYDGEFDAQAEYTAEYVAENHAVDLEAASNALFTCLDWHDAWHNVARLHVEKWLELFSDDIGVDLFTGHEFVALTSPKYYNFSTDRVFARVSFDVVQTLFNTHKANKFAVLSELLKERFTSYDGFISHYSNNIDVWLEKPLCDWDHNEIETLLLASIVLNCSLENRPLCINDFNRAVEMEVLDYGVGNGIFSPEYDETKLKEQLEIDREFA